MLYVARNREIIFNWYLYEGTNKRVVDFTEIPGCRPTAFLVNKKGQYTYRLEYQFDASAVPFVRIVIPKDSLAPDVYDMKIIWEVPEEKDIRLRLRHNNRFLAVSHITGVMKITSNASEDNTGLPVGETLVRTVKSLSESFGYDGLSAYELAVLRKGYTGTEEEYITQFERVPLYRTADTDLPDDERALSSLRAYRDFVEKGKVVRNTDIDGQDTEDTSRVPTAYALKYVKDLITPISELQGVGVLSKTASGWVFTQFPEGLQLGEDSDTAYAGDKGKKNREDIDALQRKVNELPDTVASKEELKALESKVGNKIIDLNQQVTGVGKDVESKADASDLEELRDYVSNRLSPKGSDTRPIYIDEEGAKEVNGIVVPKDIISLTGGIASKGIADFGIIIGGGTGGSGASYLIDLIDVTIYNPKNDEVLAYDTTTNKWVNKESNAATLQGYTADELLQNFSIENEAITISVGGKSLSITKEQLKRLLALQDAGSESRPIYIESGTTKEINRLSIPGDIESTNGGVAAKGVADFGIGTGAIGGSQVVVLPILEVGEEIAKISVDGYEHSIYSPDISGKVDKEAGKGLSSNDFTDQEKDKLERLHNYDDTSIWREVNEKVDKDNLKDKGNDLRPVFFDENAVANEIRGIRVPDSIESLEGGVSAKGIADFGISSGNGGGSQVKVTPLVSEGQAIAQIEVDGKQNTLYAPNPDISSKVDKTEFNTYKQEVAEDVAQLSQDINTEANTRRAKDQELTTSIKTLQDLFTEDGAANNADKLDGKSIEELFDNLDANGGINITIGGVEKTLTKSELLSMLGFENKGKHNLPVYYEDEQMKEVDSLSVTGNIESTQGGVSAKGIADFGTPSGVGGVAGIDVLRDDELESLQTENITQVASAWSVKRIKDIANVEDIPAFNPSLSYERGEYVLYNDIAWKFVENHQGEWNSGHCKRVDFNDVLTPSNVYVEDLINKYFR